jgi:hypothetical protein
MAYASNLKMKAAGSSKTVVFTYKDIQYQNPDGYNLHSKIIFQGTHVECLLLTFLTHISTLKMDTVRASETSTTLHGITS